MALTPYFFHEESSLNVLSAAPRGYFADTYDAASVQECITSPEGAKVLRSGVVDLMTGDAPLHLATAAGNAQIIGALVEAGAALNSRDGRNDTALDVRSANLLPTTLTYTVPNVSDTCQPVTKGCAFCGTAVLCPSTVLHVRPSDSSQAVI
jgi:hypothetical protein